MRVRAGVREQRRAVPLAHGVGVPHHPVEAPAQRRPLDVHLHRDVHVVERHHPARHVDVGAQHLVPLEPLPPRHRPVVRRLPRADRGSGHHREARERHQLAPHHHPVAGEGGAQRGQPVDLRVRSVLPGQVLLEQVHVGVPRAQEAVEGGRVVGGVPVQGVPGEDPQRARRGRPRPAPRHQGAPVHPRPPGPGEQQHHQRPGQPPAARPVPHGRAEREQHQRHREEGERGNEVGQQPRPPRPTEEQARQGEQRPPRHGPREHARKGRPKVHDREPSRAQVLFHSSELTVSNCENGRYGNDTRPIRRPGVLFP